MKAMRAAALIAIAALLAACGGKQPPDAPTAAAPQASAPVRADPHRAERMAAWQALGFGMFVHWGLYSELGGVWNGKPVEKGYSEQIQGWAKIAPADYAGVARRFAAPKFDADAICALSRDAGARYIVVTSKHHDGFAMFDTQSTDFDIVERTPFAKDPLKLLSDACRKQGLGFGVYFSLVDWHAGHVPEVEHNSNPIPPAMEPLIERQLRELMTHYGPIAEVWFDMAAPTREQSRRFAAIVRELQPQAAINGRIWNNAGDFVTLGDNESPPPSMRPPFQTPASIYHATWGYRSWQQRDDLDGKVRELVRGLVDVRSAGGNYLLNIGPKGDGSIVPFEAQVLHRIGAWLRRHPDALLDAEPAGLPPQPWGSATRDGDALFLFVHDWRGGELVVSGLASEPRAVRIDGDAGAAPLRWHRRGNDLVIDLPARSPDAVLPVLRVELAAAPRIVPPGAVALDAQGNARLARDAWRPGTSFGFGGGYRSQYPTTVSLQATLVPAAAQAAWLRFSAVQARVGRRYRIAVGATTRVVDARRLQSRAVGPFPLQPGTPVTVTIALADPAYPAEDMGLRFEAMSVHSGTDAPQGSSP